MEISDMLFTLVYLNRCVLYGENNLEKFSPDDMEMQFV